MLEVNKIYQGHTFLVLQTFPPESVNCIITSPPYWGLRDYGTEPLIWGAKDGCEHEWQSKTTKWHGDRGNGDHKEVYCDMAEQKSDSAFCSLCGAWRGSLGLEPTYRGYISHLMQIMYECKRVLRKDGTMWVNIGDSFSGNASSGGEETRTCQSKPNARDKYLFTKKGIPPKSLIGIPERFALAMTDELGMIRRNTIIWHKPNCMPSSAKDRFTVDFEYVYFFTKSGKYWFEAQEEPMTAPKGNPRPFAKKGNNDRNDTGRIYNPPDELTRHPRCVWTITTKPFKGAHFATFPPALVEPMIKSGCPENGVVIDPFMGSGTTGMVAKSLNRNYVGIELNPKYVKMAEKRIAKTLYQEKMAI